MPNPIPAVSLSRVKNPRAEVCPVLARDMEKAYRLRAPIHLRINAPNPMPATAEEPTTDSGTPESEIVPGETLITIVGSGKYYLVVDRHNLGSWEAHELSLWALGEGHTIREAADPSGVRYVTTGDIASVQTVDPSGPIG